jgi:hypothetical protein
MISKGFKIKHVDGNDGRIQVQYGRCENCCQKYSEVVFTIGNTRHHLCEDCFKKMLTTFVGKQLTSIVPTTKEGAPTRVFLSGPQRGYPEENFFWFHMIESVLSDNGYDVVNPVHINKKYYRLSDKNLSEQEYEKMVLEQQLAEKTCNVILLLPGWEKSAGVRLELKTALDMGMSIVQWEKLSDW